MKRIKWRVEALRQLRKIKDNNIKTNIYDAVEKLKNFPDCPNIRKLVNRDDYRLTVGKWRVVFTADLEIICIEEVLKRNERTYK